MDPMLISELITEDIAINNGLMFERMRSVDGRVMYHGTNEQALKQIFNYGLVGVPPKKTQNAIKDARAVFLTARVPLALYYGHIIVEVLLNRRSHDANPDEEHFPIGEMPNTDNKIEWDNFWEICKEQGFELTPEEKSFVYKANAEAQFADQWDDRILLIVRKILKRFRLNTNFDKKSDFESNVMYQSNIGFKGRTRIVGIYQFESIDTKTTKNIMQCIRIIYTNGGTIKLRQQFEKNSDHYSY